MRTELILLALCLPFMGISQEEWKASATSEAYHNNRMKNTVPPYGLEKVKNLLSKIDSGSEENRTLSSKDYTSLSLREKFTYTMIHGESYSQNCDVAPPIQEEHQKIMAHLPDAFDEANWSNRQMDFLNGNRDSVLALIKESVRRSGHMGLNYKTAVVEMNAKEMIPFLAETYNRDRKDHDLLTVMLLLLKINKYQPFTSSASYGKLYGKDSNYQSFIQFNTANEALVLKRATDYFTSIH